MSDVTADARDRFVWRPGDFEFTDEDEGSPEEKALRQALSDAQKSSGNYKKGHIDFQGLDVTIENPQGSTRTGHDKDGTPWSHKMYHDYGYIRRTMGTDDMQLDCYVGPDKDAEYAYVVHQVDPSTKDYDEDKCMLGWPDPDSAKAAYIKQYDDGSEFFGAMTAVHMSIFKKIIFSDGFKGKPVAPDGPQRAEAHFKSMFSDDWSK